MFQPVQVILYLIEHNQDMFERVDFHYATEIRNLQISFIFLPQLGMSIDLFICFSD